MITAVSPGAATTPSSISGSLPAHSNQFLQRNECLHELLSALHNFAAFQNAFDAKFNCASNDRWLAFLKTHLPPLRSENFGQLSFAHQRAFLDALQAADGYLSRVEHQLLEHGSTSQRHASPAALLSESLRRERDILLDPYRAEIRDGQFESVREAIKDRMAPTSYNFISTTRDDADAFFDALFGFDQSKPGYEQVVRSYELRPIRMALPLIERLTVSPHDTIGYVGAGTGRMPALLTLFTPAKVVALERSPLLAEASRNTANSFGLARIEIRNEDARNAHYDGINCLCLFDLMDDLLKDVVEKFQQQAEKRFVHIAAFGDSISFLDSLPWVKRSDTFPGSIRGIFKSTIEPKSE